MIGYDVDEAWENPPAIARSNYSIWRLMIDRTYQGRGFGRGRIDRCKKAIEDALGAIKKEE